MASNHNDEVISFLKEQNLEEHTDGILKMKVHSLNELQDIETGDLESIGMNKIEIKRFFRALKEALELINTNQSSSQINEIINVSESSPYSITPDQEKENSSKQVSDLLERKVIVNLKRMLSISEYKTITIKTCKSMLTDIESRNNKMEFDELIPIVIYYLKCGLSFDELKISWCQNRSSDLPRTNDAIFHSIFHKSDALVKALCIDDYSVNFPVPFYYPSITSLTEKDEAAMLKICHELWFIFPKCLTFASFGLGKANWSPVGKSTFLDLILNTDFVSKDNSNSPYHLKSIDVQVLKNIKIDSKVAVFDCHSGVSSEIVRTLVKYVNIIFIHVLHENLKEDIFAEELQSFSKHSKHVILLVRDTNQITDMPTSIHCQTVSIPNLKQIDKPAERLLINQFRDIFKDIDPSQTVDQSLVENVMRELKDPNLLAILDSKRRIGEITKLIENKSDEIAREDDEKCLLSFYPIFVEYMNSHHKANHETNQKSINELNEKCARLSTKLSQARTSNVTDCFLELFNCEYSPLLIRSLSEYLKALNKVTHYKYSIDILWREALLSFKYDETRTEPGHIAFTSKLQQCLCKHLMDGEPFELIDGDNLVFYSKDIDILLQEYYKAQNEILDEYNRGKSLKLSAAPLVISILGPQNSGKSTLLNYLFGCRFVTSSGRCTKGVYGSLFQLDENINNSKTLLILDTEGLSAVERKNLKKENLINFDRTLALFCLAVSQVVIINIVGDINAELQTLLELCAYSLTRLKVNKVALPKLFFVLNQQIDPDVKKHASCLNSMMESLEMPMLISAEESKISDLIQISHKQLTILPSAFNSKSIDSPFCRDKHNKPVKHETTEDFLMKCAGLKDMIFDEIQLIPHNEKQPFENISEWIQMAGHIWETCVKYQDIVMYRGVEEMKFSQTLSDIYIKLIENEIDQKRQIFLDSLDTIFKEIDQIEYLFDPKGILIEQMGKFKEIYDPCRDKCKGGFQKQAGELAEFEQFKFVYEQAESNMNRLIHNILKGYEDMLKYRIKFNYLELKLAKSMKTFKNRIELRLDDYLNMSPDQKSQEFDENWRQCYHYDFEDERNIKEECFATLYSNFKMECNFIETRQTILKLFSKHNFDMEKIISEMESEILYNLKNVNLERPEDWYFCTLNQSYGNLKRIRPHNKRTRCMYLSPKSLLQSQDTLKIKMFRKNSKLSDWIPEEWGPIVKSCSGDYNYYEIVWGECPEKIQILHLVSKLRNPQDFTNSCWDTFLNEVREQTAELLLKKDPELSQTTIKLLVNDLKISRRVVNHEIRYIRAMLSNRAERALSTLLFSYAFKVFLNHHEEQIKLEAAHRESKKDGLKGYFFQKIENRKMLKGDWDTENMRANDLKISETFALSYIEAVKRYVLSSIETKVEKRIERENEALTMVKLLSEANQIIGEMVEINPEIEIVDTDNFVIQFICNRNCLLEKLFHQRFGELEEKLNVIMHNEAKKLFAECINLLVQQLLSLQEYFDTFPEEIKETNRLYSDKNFVLCESMENVSVQSKEAPFRAMSLYLSMYLNPKFLSKDFSEHFKKTFDIENIKVKRSDNYILREEKSGHAIRPEDFKRLESTDIFFKELIFNIYTFIENFRRILLTKSEDFSLNPDFMLQLFKRLRSHFLKDALGCDMRCPSCGKFCEKPIHNDGSKCQISNGHQLSSMGGKVWKNDSEHTAVLFMCDDYHDFMDVKLPDSTMKWRDFKSSCGSEWNWETSDDPNFEALRQAQRYRMQEIWSKFGRGILQSYSMQGIHISYIPVSLREMKSISTNYYICFLIDGTGSMRKDIERARLSVSKLAIEYQQRASKCNFRVVIYRDHCDEDIIETCPNDSSFSNETDSIGAFLEGIKAEGGGDNPEAMLDGFASSITLTNWRNDKSIKNILVHIFDAPPHGNFPNYKQHHSDSNQSNCCCCNHGSLCLYDWDEHVWNPMRENNIFYHGINTSRSYTQFESTMKSKLGEFCREFQVCGKEQVDEAVLQIFVDFNVSKLDRSTSYL